MTANKNFWLSLALVVCALACQFSGTHLISANMKAKARSLRLPEDQARVLKTSAALEAKIGLGVVCIGYLSAISSLVFCRLSAKRNEPVSRAIPIALLICFFLSQFLLV